MGRRGERRGSPEKRQVKKCLTTDGNNCIFCINRTNRRDGCDNKGRDLEGKNERNDKKQLNSRGPEIHFALGGDGHTVGHQPDGRSSACAALSLAASAPRR